MGADSNNVGSIRRKEDKGKTEDEMGGCTEEDVKEMGVRGWRRKTQDRRV